MTAAPPDPPPRDPSIRPDYDDFRDEEGRIDWRAFRAAVAAYDPDGDAKAAPSGG